MSVWRVSSLLDIAEKMENTCSLEEFFISRKLLNSDQLEKVSSYREQRKKYLGNYAIELKMVTIEDVEEVLERQKHDRRFFGEIALELGKLTQAQLSFLLRLQCENTLHFGELLVRLGFMTKETMLDEVNTFIKMREFIMSRYQEKEAVFVKKFRETLINSVNITNYENVLRKFLAAKSKEFLGEDEATLSIKKDDDGYYITLKSKGHTSSAVLNDYVLFGSFNGEADALASLKSCIERMNRQLSPA